MKEKITAILYKELHLPKSEVFTRAIDSFTYTEKTIFYAFVVLLAGSAFALGALVNNMFMVEVPTQGGSLTEGVIGTPRFINPLLALTDTDRDLTSLIYSGLMKPNENGDLIPDLAKNYNVSDDGLTYTFVLRDNATFHDGQPVTADDIEYTIQMAQDNSLKSPRRASWDGVTVTTLSATEIQFTLKQPYAPFLENTTMGVLPKHIWRNTSAEQFSFSRYNSEPIGSGPYKISATGKNSTGIPEYYELTAFSNYTLGQPYLSKLRFQFYANEKTLIDAYNSRKVESVAGISPGNAAALKRNDVDTLTAPLPRIFSVFFNQGQSEVLSRKEVRQALSVAVDKNALVTNVLHEYGTVIQGPLPVGVSGLTPEAPKAQTQAERITAAQNILTQNGWVMNDTTHILEKKLNKQETLALSFDVNTSDAPELKATAAYLQTTWAEIGADVTVKTYDSGELNQSVIRPRKYDALLFGEVIGRDLDLFAFWHTSQRNDPGLNIALYANSSTDKLLETARVLQKKQDRIDKYQEFEKEVVADIPAIFLYSPDFIYFLPDRINGVSLNGMTVPSERFLGIEKWYVDTDHVWRIFAPDSAYPNE